MKLTFQVSDLITINEKLGLRLTDRRIAHMAATVGLAAELSEKHNFELTEDMKTVLFLHDIARNLESGELIGRVDKSGFIPENLEIEKPVLLHAPAGAAIIREMFPRIPEQYIFAVRNHTLLSGDKHDFIQKLLAVCDFSERGRKYPEARAVRETAFTDIDKAFSHTILYRKKFHSGENLRTWVR